MSLLPPPSPSLLPIVQEVAGVGLQPGNDEDLRRRVHLVGRDALREGRRQHEGLPSRAGLTATSPARHRAAVPARRRHFHRVAAGGRFVAAAEGQVHVGEGPLAELASADQGVHEAGLRLDGRHRHLQRLCRAGERTLHRLVGRILNLGIQCRLNPQAALVHLLRAVLGEQVALHVVHEGGVLGLVRLGRQHHRGLRGCRSLGQQPHLLGHGGVVLGRREVALLQHPVKDELTPGLRGVGVLAWCPGAGGGDEPGDHGRFGQGELVDGLAEVGLRRRSDPVAAVTEVDRREVAVEDLVLGGLAVELAGQDPLPHLSDERAGAAGVGVLDVLLGDGGSPLNRLLVAHVGHQGPQAAPNVDPAVLVEIAVLDRDHRLLQHVGNVRFADLEAQLDGAKGGDQIAVAVEDLGGHAGRRRLGLRDRRRKGQEEEGRQHRGGEDHRHADADREEQHCGSQHDAQHTKHHPARSFAHQVGGLWSRPGGCARSAVVWRCAPSLRRRPGTQPGRHGVAPPDAGRRGQGGRGRRGPRLGP